MNVIIAAGGGDLIFFIVILIIVGIGKLIKAAMQGSGSGQQSPTSRQGLPAGEDRVRKFLEQVTGVPLEPQPQPKPRRQRRAKPKPKPKEELAPEPVGQHHLATNIQAIPPTKPRDAYRFDADKLRSPKGLRDVVVLREILDKPLALRRRARRAIPIR